MKLKRTHESVLINNGVFFLSVLNGVNNDPTKTKLKWNKQLTRCGVGAVLLYGESEDNICELFTKAFIHEIDAIASKRKNLQRETDRRIVAQLLICIDEPHRATNDGNKKSKQAFYAGIIMLHSILKMINHLDSISLMKLLLETSERARAGKPLKLKSLAKVINHVVLTQSPDSWSLDIESILTFGHRKGKG
ncbi:cell division control protein 48 homolog C [Tanacetum coccineum]